MSWAYDYEHNPWDNPEAVGLRIVGSIECGGGYEFDTFVVWQADEGTLWYASDSGCSCPVPFEDVKGFDDLSPINRKTFPQFENDLREHGEGYGSYSGIGADKLALTQKVIQLGGKR